MPRRSRLWGPGWAGDILLPMTRAWLESRLPIQAFRPSCDLSLFHSPPGQPAQAFPVESPTAWHLLPALSGWPAFACQFYSYFRAHLKCLLCSQRWARDTQCPPCADRPCTLLCSSHLCACLPLTRSSWGGTGVTPVFSSGTHLFNQIFTLFCLRGQEIEWFLSSMAII